MKTLFALLNLLVLATSASGADSCEQLDLRAIHLARTNQADAARVLDEAIAKCPPDAGRLRSRGVVYAVMGDKANAERSIEESIRLYEKNGDRCEADLSRAELATIKGRARLATRPESCASRR
jgi:Flp pilus assembly protein TadD